LCFTISDTGIGIAPANLPKLFQSFVQIDNNLNRQYAGTGLGLALVKQIVELHGGTVTVTSALNQGSCFTVRLPWINSANSGNGGNGGNGGNSLNSLNSGAIAPSPTSTPPLASSSPMMRQPNSIQPQPTPAIPSAGITQQQVIVIEDSPTAAQQLARYLQGMGMHTTIYPYGEGAFAEIARIQPTMVILDIQLPNLSGWDVLTQLKQHSSTQAIPVIVVSVEDERPLGLAMGASDYLIKPLNRAEFHASLQQVLSTLPTLTDPSPNLQPSVFNPAPSLAQPLILLAEDNLANIETMSVYLECRGYRVILANNGHEALAMMQQELPDVVVMDVQMPGMDGLEATRQIRAKPEFSHIPIIAVTALAMAEDRQKCLDAGANEYLSKPVKLKQLADTIHQFVSMKALNSPAID